MWTMMSKVLSVGAEGWRARNGARLGRKLAGLLFVAGVLAGCGTSPEPDFYTLEPVKPATTQSLVAKVALRQVAIAGYLDRPQMVQFQDAYRIDINEYSRWAEPFGQMLSRVLVVNLSNSLPQSTVFLESYLGEIPSEMAVDVGVSRFEANKDGTITLEAQWVVRTGLQRKFAFAGRRSFSGTPTRPCIDDDVAVMSELMGELSDAIAASLVQYQRAAG